MIPKNTTGPAAEQIFRAYEMILDGLRLMGYPTDDDNFRETAPRAAKALLELVLPVGEIERAVDDLVGRSFGAKYDEMVISKHNVCFGVCPHHLLPVIYRVSVAYLPMARVVGISKQIDKKVEANRANVAKGPAGHLGSRLRTELAKQNLRLPLLGDDDATADRNYIKEFALRQSRELGKQYGVEYAEAFHYIPLGAAGADRDPRVEKYVKEHAIPIK